jgi:hypothetical protein
MLEQEQLRRIGADGHLELRAGVGQTSRHILNLAAKTWRDEDGRT